MFDNIINEILITINSNEYLKKIFYNKTNNRKYNIELLINCILYILKMGLTYRAFNILLNFIDNNIKFPYYTTFYKFYMKLLKYDIIKLTYIRLVKKYKSKNISNKYFMDTTLIVNKLGIDKIGFNVQLLKHKTTKLSIICDNKGIPLNIDICKGSTNDSKIIINQLIQLSKDKIIKLNNKNFFIGDAGYDSNNIRLILKENNLGKLITNKNKRNCKNKELLNKLNLSKYEKKQLKTRFIIEHTNNRIKQFKRINIRYDKYSNMFINFIYLSSIILLLDKI